jgi:hypothetical protein
LCERRLDRRYDHPDEHDRGKRHSRSKAPPKNTGAWSGAN